MQTSPIRLLVPDMPSHTELLPYLTQIEQLLWYTNFGPMSRKFESRIAECLEISDDAVCSVANCTMALEAALATLDLRRDARVLIPGMTFVATASAVLRSGFLPVLSDVDNRKWILTPEIARECMRHGPVDCVIPVAAFGCPVDVVAWDAFYEDTGIPVLIDAAGAFGNQPVGRHGVVAFSFHATKTLGCGEGGLVASSDVRWISQFRQFTNFGIDAQTGEVKQAGTNAKLSEYHAAVGLASLDSWTEKVARRRKIHGQYLTKLAGVCLGVRLQDRPVDGIYSIMQVQLPDGKDAKRVADRLNWRGIETRRWYLPPLSAHPVFRDVMQYGALPTVSELAGSLIGLPFHALLSEQEIDFICTQLADSINA